MTNSYPFTVLGDEFKGKRVLVTGGTKGIGEAIARRFALSGASVATTARSEAAHGQDSALFIKTDIGTARGVQNVVDGIQREWGGLDILVNNVGGTETKAGGFEVLSDEDWQRILEVNLLAAVRLDRAFLPGMIERKSGVVIHISSVQHRLPFSNSTLAYAAAKGPLATYSKGLAKGVAPKGVRVTMISPGFIETSGLAEIAADGTSFRILVPSRSALHATYFLHRMRVHSWPLASGNGRKDWTKYPAQIEESIAYQVLAKRRHWRRSCSA
jgi:NAD(P)-dependent dehydrogenase (short-subunit alcohol dehydrogenase family)